MLHSSLLAQIDEIARAGSIRRAAETLNVSASSINRRLINLEESLGAPLFYRLSSGMRLTSAGEVVVAHIRQTLRDHQRMTRRLEELRGLRGLRLRVSAMHGLASGILPRILRQFLADYPGVSVTVRARVVADVEADLVSGEADLGLAYALSAGHGIEATAVFPTRLGAVVAPGHPLAERSDLRLSELRDWPIAIADESITINALISEAFARAGLDLAPAYLSNSIDLLKSIARAGEAVTFLSRIDVDEDLRNGGLRYVPLLGHELRSHELRLGRRRGAALNPAVTLAEERIRAAIGAIDYPGVLGPPGDIGAAGSRVGR